MFVLFCVGFVLVAAILFMLYCRTDNKCLDAVPGPPGLPFVGLLWEVICPLEDLIPKALAWARTYGPVIRLEAMGVVRILICGPDEIEVLLKNRHNITKDVALNFLHPWLGSGLLTSTGDKWRSRRRIVAPAFHYKTLEDVMPIVNANSAILVEKLKNHLQDDYVEIEDFIAQCTLDIICETMLGVSVQAQRGGGDEYLTAVKRMFQVFEERVKTPWLHLDWVYWLSPLRWKEKRAVRVLHEFSFKVIHQRSVKLLRRGQSDAEATSNSLNFLDLLLQKCKEGELTEEEVREEVDTILVTGHDSTATTLTWALFLLGSHSEVQDKVISELSEMLSSDRRQPKLADLRRLTYLDMVVREVMRLYPSSPNIGRRLNTTLKIGQYTLPAGTDVVISLGIVQRDPEIFPEPDKFNPERFSLEKTSGWRHPYAYIPFSSGPRACIGQRLGRIIMWAILAAIFRNFRVESLKKPKDVKMIPGVVLKPQEKIKMKISPI